MCRHRKRATGTSWNVADNFFPSKYLILMRMSLSGGNPCEGDHPNNSVEVWWILTGVDEIGKVSPARIKSLFI